ncbi:MAG: hypothetical protein G8237_15095 [Magnetococcales bacterium]|nr:hypothetical protein [Magnetococcales bacterium]
MTELIVADVGVERFNNDHQRLLFYVIEFNRLACRFRERAPCDDEWDQIELLFPRLVRYTQEHFQAEEALMARHAYPDLEEHVVLHRQLIDHLAALQVRVAARQVEAIVHLDSFLLDWLQTHINRDDLKYRGCFQLAETREIQSKALFNEMISAEQLQRLLQLAPGDMVLLDLRTETEHRTGVIPGSRLFPCDHNLDNREDTGPFQHCFAQTFDPALFSPEQWYVLICRSGPRTAIALEYFQNADLPACELIGGIQEWTRQGYLLVSVEN